MPSAMLTRSDVRPLTAADRLDEGSGLTGRLRAALGESRYRRWFGEGVRVRCEGGSVEVVAPSAFHADMIERQFTQTLREAAQADSGRADARVEIRVDPNASGYEEHGGAPRPEGLAPSATASTAQPSPRSRAGEFGDSPPTPSPAGPGRFSGHGKHAGKRAQHFKLEDFVVGSSNALAYECAARLADAESEPPFRLLFLHGECGVGKTHLLAGVAARYGASKPAGRVRCVTAEAFLNEYIAALQSNSIDAFRRRHRDLDMLCIDDIHFLGKGKKESTLTEFLHTFDALELKGTRICLASDEHPTRVRSFSKELVSRFLSGMVVEVERPDRATARRIAQSVAARKGMALDEPAAAQIVGRCDGSARDIVGAVTRLDFLRRLPGMGDGRVTPALIEQAVARAAVERPRRPMRADRIIEHVADALGVEVSETLGRSRHKRVVLARSLAAHLIKKLTTMSYPEIAKAMGRPNHSSVITAVQRVEGQIKGGALCGCGPGLDDVTVEALAERLERELVRVAAAA